MNREIKFRAWDGENMIYESRQKEYDDYYILNLQGEFFPHTRTGDNDFVFDKDPLNKKKFVLMQFTGLYDKNGKEIYEGDFLRPFLESIGPYRIEFENGSFTCYHKHGRWGFLSLAFELNDYELEVIGNIYENSELIYK